MRKEKREEEHDTTTHLKFLPKLVVLLILDIQYSTVQLVACTLFSCAKSVNQAFKLLLSA